MSLRGLSCAFVLLMAGIAFGSPATMPTTNPSTMTGPATAPAIAPPVTELGKVTVTSTLDQARAQIAPSLGAVTYTQTAAQIQAIPQGDNAPFQQVLLRNPGVVEDSFGQVHVRGEHANVTYRINGVLLPEGLNGFGQELDSRLIDNVTLIDGTLPAQFGFHTAGIVDVTAKSGATLDHNELSYYGGSYNTIQPSAQFGGTSGNWDYFVTTSYLHNEIGIENPTSSYRPDHDATDQERGFGYFSYNIDDTSRVSFIENGYYGDFQIPNVPGQPPQFDLIGNPPVDSAHIDESQNEQQYYNVVSYQKSTEDLSFQASVFSQYGQIHFTPDPAADLIFLGTAGEVLNSFLTNGVQIDSSYNLNRDHTLRFGLLGSYEFETLNTDTLVFPGGANPDGSVFQTPGATTPMGITEDSHNHALATGVYAQDEWKINKQLTLNYGLRFDSYNATFDNENQLSPRVNLVDKLDDATTAHVGFARYFVPPPTQDITPEQVAKFDGTTNAASVTSADPPKVERSSYVDAGISHQINQAWSVNVDAYYKQARQLIDLGQFGQAVILSPYNYKSGYHYGAEMSSSYTMDGFSVFGNFSYCLTRGRDIDSQEFQIASDELAYIKTHYIPLDHQGEYTFSGGISDKLTPHDLIFANVLYGSGLRGGFANDEKEPQYAPVSLGYQHIFQVDPSGKDLIKLRFDVVNLFDEVYRLRSGSGIGVEAPQFGQRRGYFVGLDYDF